jgi:hypothetical protein
MMTRKDYVETAEILNSYASYIPSDVFEDLIYDFSVMFENDNPKFDADRFTDECYKNTNH